LIQTSPDPMLRPFLFATVALHCPAFAESRFEFRDGDRVALIGDAFIEREQYEGWIELAMTSAFPDRSVVFRNLGWSADTPAGASRNGLSLGQAGHEPPGEGWRQLEGQLETYKPNVLVTGYGMAASLPGGQTPEEFKRDFERLLDRAAKREGGVRVLVLGAPPRFLRPGETEESVKAHRESLAAINRVLREVAEQRGHVFVSLDPLAADSRAFSENGIHLGAAGYRAAARLIERELGWPAGKWDQGQAAEALRAAILRKNEWFFHRSRPANMAYIFGFRKGEQGRNAGEIPEFDKLVAEEEARIAAMRDLSKGVIVPAPQARIESKFAAKTRQPYPEFTVADGYEVTLWAENPMLHKPTQMNFDARGRLWVASAETYPQVEVGQTADDKIVVLEDTDQDGKADTSKVFATGLLMPTGVLPGDGGCYVAQSTDLLHFTDSDGDGTADTKRRVLSGFGTEDTHHNLHTLRRGPDGKLWMNQSIYTRSDVETPHGLTRLKSGGVMRFDPRTDKLETVFYGWCNPWGHQFDAYGQSFVTDGAGGSGVNWGVPGAMYFTYARAGKILDGISPGSYPKFCGLEIVESPQFPAEWQGSMITCDFRAHRIVRFAVADQGSGYAAQEAGDLLRTSDVNFRPIDVKIGPDGALYIADWSNPIINHGEVDFRDPRRDREHGRIWRVSRKGAPPVKPRDLAEASPIELLERLTRDHRHEREAAMSVLVEREGSPELDAAIRVWAAVAKDGRTRLAALWLSEGRGMPADWGQLGLLSQVLADEDGRIRAAGVRVLGDQMGRFTGEQALGWLAKAANDPHPRVRLEAVRVLAELPGAEPMDLAFQVLRQPMDRFLEYALWLNVRDRGAEWLAALLDGRLALAGRESALDFALANLPPEKGIEGIRKLMPKPLPRDGAGPWLGLALKTADPAMLAAIYSQVLDGGFDAPAAATALRGLEVAVTQRQSALPGDALRLRDLLESSAPDTAAAALRLAGALRAEGLLDPIKEIAGREDRPMAVRMAAVDGLSHFASDTARDAMLSIGSSAAPAELKRAAALALVRHHRAAALGAIRALLPGLGELSEARAFWQQALSLSRLSGDLAKSFQEQALDPKVAALNLPAVPDIDEHAELLGVLRQQAGGAAMSGPTSAEIPRLAKLAAEKGDAARGEAVYRQPGLACIACHAIGGAGGRVGPDMTSIGASAPLDYLVESILIPAAKVKEGYHSVVIETKDGRTLMGRLLRSGGGQTVLADAAGTEIALADAAIVKRSDSGSLMPANLIAGLTEQEQLDLFKFLSELGKPGAFDATKSRAPRVWAVMPLAGEMPEAAAKGDSSLPWIPINGTVNGTLLAADVAPFAAGAGEILAAARVQLSEAADVVLSFPQAPPGVWVDGRPVNDGRVRLGPGIHKIVVRHKAGADLRFESSAGTFLPTW
jgi:putative heme-binding domain-containing protein